MLHLPCLDCLFWQMVLPVALPPWNITSVYTAHMWTFSQLILVCDGTDNLWKHSLILMEQNLETLLIPSLCAKVV